MIKKLDKIDRIEADSDDNLYEYFYFNFQKSSWK
jgi:hypothetical protein